MAEKFRVEFLPEAVGFMEGLDQKAQQKIYFNIKKAQLVSDVEIFKKLTDTIWEFRTLYNKMQYRIFAFWDKTQGQNTLVLATHGLIKKTGRTPKQDLEKAERIRQEYFEQNKLR
jgi:phage-related protein